MIVGIDPGLDGAAAALTEDFFVCDVIDLPIITAGKRREINPVAFHMWLNEMRPKRIIMEHVHSMPHDGHVSAFRFGVAVGMLKGISRLFVKPVELVEPNVWKAYYKLLGQDKEASRARALQLLPAAEPRLTRKMDHQRAEALLIARWGLRPPIGRDW